MGKAARVTGRLVWDILMIGLALFSVAMIFWFDGVSAAQQTKLIHIDLAIVALFAADWAWHFRKAEDKKRFLRRNWIDLLGMVPLYFTTFGFLRLLRMVRILRIIRLFRAAAGFIERTQELAKKSNLGRIALVSALVTFVGSTLVWLAERNSNPGFEQYSEALWWSIVTVTTVGYGDITPQTALGRALAAVLMVVGIGIIGVLASQVSVAVLKGDAVGTIAGDMERLAAIHSKGQLTDVEFAAAKEKLLEK